MKSSLRVAWLGPTPSDGGGVAYMAAQVLRLLPSQGLDVDVFIGDRPQDVPADLADLGGLSIVSQDSGWRYDRWYSSNPMSTLLTGQLSRLRTQRSLMANLRERHQRHPYDVMYQFSQLEPPSLRAPGRDLPPLVVHPETHAGGELRAHLRERHLSAEASEPSLRRGTALAMFGVRSAVQRKSIKHVSHVVAPSQNFARHLRTDYGLASSHISVVANPVDLNRFSPRTRTDTDRLRIVVAGRVSARKGIELVVELSRRLHDLRDDVELVVVGGPSLWSDYRPLLAGLDADVATYLGPLRGEEMAAVLADADLLVQPSHYEPFALTVGEALACGVPVVVSDEVGAGELVDGRCCRRFVTGSADSLERAVRGLLLDLGRDSQAIREVARTEAERLFDPRLVVAQVADVLRAVAATQPRR